MKIINVVCALCLCACSNSVMMRTSKMEPEQINKVFGAAKTIFSKTVSCPFPNVKVSVVEKPLVIVNFGRRIFRGDGVYIQKGFYDVVGNSIVLVSEMPEQRVVMFDIYFKLLLDKSGCSDKIDDEQFIFNSREAFYQIMGIKREEAEDLKWVYPVLKEQYGIEVKKE